MKSSVSFVSLFLCAGLIWAQSPAASKSSAPAAQAPEQLHVRGPEATAQQEPNRVVATINGKQITAKQAEEMLKQVPEDQKKNVPNLASLLQRVYMIDQFADQAEKQKLDQQSPTREELALNRTQILAQAYINQIGKDPSNGPDAAKQYYDAHVADFDELKLSGILVAFNPPGTPATGASVSRTEADAQAKANDLEKKIKAGGDFSALARTDSDNEQSAVHGGELGTFVLADGTLPATIRPVVLGLKPGEVSQPFRVNGGFYIFKVDSRTKLPFDQVRAGIVRKLEFDKYKIQVQDPDFFDSANASASHIPSLQRPGSPTLTPPGKAPGQ